jgi:hypothetical protein
MSTTTVILIAIAVLAVVFAVIMYMQKERTRHLQGKFGPEYERLAKIQGNQKAEQELLNRQKRIEKFHIRALNPSEIDRFSTEWRNVQTRFVDSPREAVADADRLIGEVMSNRGYPVSNFEQSAADISVDHPQVVENYRTAHMIAARDAAGKATTEDLRQAMMHYRSLFEDLLSAKSNQHLHEVTR